jgi:hypothetical protein
MADQLYVPQVDYTSRDYESIREDLIGLIPNFSDTWTSRESTDFGIVLLELFSYMGDLLNYYIDRAANESFIDTSTQRSTVLAIAKLLNYSPTEVVAATGSVTFTNNSTTTAQTVPALTKLSGVSDSDGGSLIFETDAAVTVPANGSANVTVTQGVTVSNEQVGVATGVASQKYQLAETNIITGSATSSGVSAGSILVTIGGVSYTPVSSLVNSTPTSLHFELSTDSEGYTTLLFGDGVYGKIPPKGNLIQATYRTGSGSLGNVSAGAITSVLETPNGTYPLVNVYNATAISGGEDPESTDSIRAAAPKALSALNRAVSLADYQNLAAAIPGVAKASAISSVFSYVTLYVVAAGGSVASSSLKTSIINYFADKTPPGTTVTVLDYTPVFPDVRVTVTADSLYFAADVSARVQEAIYDVLTFDNVTLNDVIYEADIVKAASSVEGVRSVTVTGLSKKYQYYDVVAASTVSTIYCFINELPILLESNVDVNVVGGI